MERFKGYALAISICCLAIPIALRFDNPSSCFMLAVMAVSLFGGQKPGWLSVGLLTLAFDYFFIPPTHHLTIAQDSIVRLFFFAGAAFLATVLIDSKKRSDLARRQRETDFRELAKTCPDGVIVINEDNDIQFSNAATSGLFGYSVEELRGKQISLLLPEMELGQPPAGEFSGRHRGGEHFDVEATCGRFENKTTIFLRDITDRKRIQRELELSESALRLTLDSIPGLVFSRSSDGAVEYANRHALEYLGFSLEQVRQEAWIETLHPDEKDWVLATIAENYAKGKAYSMEYRRRRFDGVYRWFETKVQPLVAANGEVARWYGILNDVDDRRKMEESLRQTQTKLAHASQVATASELAASIVHEISQPIAAMVANGQAGLRWLSGDPPNDVNARASIEKIVRDGKDAAEIIKGLRDLFRKTPPQKVLLDLRHLVKEVSALIQGRAERHSVVIDVQVPEELPEVIGDRIQLQQVLLNLSWNAIESMTPVSDRPRRLTIRSFQQENEILTEVEDTGIGIEDYEKIFETFFTTKKEGMGMGLSICRTIIEAHDGRLWARPGPSGGTIFSFTIFLAADASIPQS